MQRTSFGALARYRRSGSSPLGIEPAGAAVLLCTALLLKPQFEADRGFTSARSLTELSRELSQAFTDHVNEDVH